MFDSPLPESLQCSLLAAGQRAHQTLSAVQSLQSPFKPVLGSILLFCSFLSFHCLYCWFLPALDLKLSVSEYVTDTFLASSLRIFGLFFICFLAYHAPCVLSHTNFSSWCRINLMFLFLACSGSVLALNYNLLFSTVLFLFFLLTFPHCVFSNSNILFLACSGSVLALNYNWLFPTVLLKTILTFPHCAFFIQTSCFLHAAGWVLALNYRQLGNLQPPHQLSTYPTTTTLWN